MSKRSPVAPAALVAVAWLLALAGCSDRSDLPTAAAGDNEAAIPQVAASPAPEEAEALPLAERDATGAVRVVRSAISLLKAGDLDRLAQLVTPDAQLRQDLADLDSKRDAYPKADATVGDPGPIEGAAGSLFIEVPVTVYPGGMGQAADRRRVAVTLRRVNDVPGSSAAQRSWRIVEAKTVKAPDEGG